MFQNQVNESGHKNSRFLYDRPLKCDCSEYPTSYNCQLGHRIMSARRAPYNVAPHGVDSRTGDISG